MLYILPVPRFFSRYGGLGGHVAHACGIVSGLVQAGYILDIIVEEAHPTIQRDETRLHVYPIGTESFCKRQIWGWYLINKVRHIASDCRPKFCYVRYSVGFAMWLPALRRMLARIPLVLEVNTFAAQYCSSLKWLDMLALRSADIIISISELNRKNILEKVSGGLNSQILVLPNGVDIERFEKAQPYKPSGKHDHGVRLGYTGILKPNYGLEVLLEAFSKVRSCRKDVTLHIYGDGPYRRELEAQAASMDGTTFHGAAPFVEMPRVIKGLDILIGTTSAQNIFGSPTKLYEYMAAGKPIIYARTPQVESVLGNEERGLMYSLSEPDDLAKQIMMLLDDPGLATRLAANALQEAREKHSWKNRVETLLEDLKRRGLIDN